MELDSVRELKQALMETHTQTFLESAQPDTGPWQLLGMAARPMAATNSVPRTLALGVSAQQGKEYRLAVRIQHRSLERSPQLERIVQQAKGEVDVRYVGEISKRAWYQERRRPLQIGASLGHFSVSAGTLGAFVRDRSDNGLRILSNNHVLADENRAKIEDSILQPGPLDHGGRPADIVGRLSKFIPLLATETNLVDCALATIKDGIGTDLVTLQDVGRLAGLGDHFLDKGTPVGKIGRMTGYTQGHITAFEMDNVVVGYGIGNLRFDDQIEIEGTGEGPFSQGGDSGSLVFDADCRGVGLLFAGSDQGGANHQGLTYANPLRKVLDELGVNLAL